MEVYRELGSKFEWNTIISYDDRRRMKLLISTGVNMNLLRWTPKFRTNCIG